jgi:uncharacterized RDD family membrane protein YckC/Tfp pilus assembly major pilin PilA
MSDPQWFYSHDGANHGPVSTAFLQDAVAGQRLPRDIQVWRDGMETWKPYGEVDELHVALPAHAPPLPPPSAASARDTPAVVYAGFWRRFLALLLDNLILSVPAAMLAFGVAFAVGGSLAGEDEAAVSTTLVYYLVFGLASALYFALQESSSYQATLGKRALGIKVSDLDGRRLTFGNALGRWFATALSYITCYVGFLMAAFTSRKQALHDMVAGTLVVDRWAYTEHSDRQKSELSGCLVAAIVVFALGIPMLGILAAIAIPAYQDYTIRAKVSESIAAVAPAKLAIEEAFANDRRCPSNGERGIGTAASYATPHTTAVNAGTMQNGHCAVEIVVHDTGRKDMEGQRIWLELDPGRHDAGRWTCSSEIAARYLPAVCRP